MKPLAFLLVFGLPLHLFATDDVPKPFDFSRYQTMMDRSPFAVATAVAQPAATPDFAKDLFVANAAHAKDGDLVTIASSADKNFKRYLTTSAPVDGFSISSIEWSDKVGATRVTIAKDGQFATLTFNQALVAQAIPGQNNAPSIMPQPMPQLNPPVQMPNAPQVTFPRPMPVPSLPNSSQTRVRGVIPRAPARPPAPVTTPVPEG
ncbi:MAG TPA: hypothetical protein VGI42_06490 [Chthoniobacterales bacterium]|jgi:hypothetical protein